MLAQLVRAGFIHIKIVLNILRHGAVHDGENVRGRVVERVIEVENEDFLQFKTLTVIPT